MKIASVAELKNRRFYRDSKEASQFGHIAELVSWDRHPDKALGVARAIYLRLPEERNSGIGRGSL